MPRLAGDHVHLRAAVGQDRMDADRVLVPEGLAERIDRHEPDLRGVERIDAHVRRAAGMGRPPDVADELADAAVVRQRHRRPAVLRARRGVDHHRQVHVVEVAEAHQFGLAPEELERARRALAHAPLEVAALLRGHGEEHHAARQVRHHARVVKRHRRAQHSRHLRVVAARVRGARERDRPPDAPPPPSASSSPMSANVGPAPWPPATSARTPVNASPVRGASPMPRSVSSTSFAVFTSLNPSSGLRQIRSPIPMMSAPADRPPPAIAASVCLCLISNLLAPECG